MCRLRWARLWLTLLAKLFETLIKINKKVGKIIHLVRNTLSFQLNANLIQKYKVNLSYFTGEATLCYRYAFNNGG